MARVRTTAGSDIDALFQLPLNEFTPARNALAAKLEEAGRADEAARVKGLAKPPVSAWAVNQLYWRQREPFDRLMAAGDRLRTAQTSQLRGKGGELHEPLQARTAALSELSRHATTLLRESGHTPSPDLMRRITTTLEALSAYGTHASATAAGRLTDDIDAPGFDVLAALVPRTDGGTRGSGRRRVLPFVPQRKRKTARDTLDPRRQKEQQEAERRERLAKAAADFRAVERSLADARKNTARAEAALKKAAARASETRKAQDALSVRLEKAAAAAEHARQEAHRIAAEAEEAAQIVTDAERALEDARRRCESLKN